MKKLLIFLFLSLSAFGQTVSSGRELSSGLSSMSGHSQGGPLTYPARTDPCVLGFALDPTNCISGATAGQAGSALSFLGQTGDAMPWYQTPGTIDAPNTAIVDPDFGSYQVMVTSGAWGFGTVGLGTNGPIQNYEENSGEWDPFAQDNSLLISANSGGGYVVVALDVNLIHAKQCAPQGAGANTTCTLYTGIKTGTAASDPACPNQSIAGTGCTRLNSGGSFSFSRTPGEAHVIYELLGSGTQAAQVQVNKLLVSCPAGAPGTWTSGCTFTRTPYVNFTSDYADPNANAGGVAGAGTISAPCSIVPPEYTSNSPWTGSFSPANDGSIGYTAGGAGDWGSAVAYVAGDSFIFPRLNSSCTDGLTHPSPACNEGGYAYQATFCGAGGMAAACAQGGTEPALFSQTAPAAGNGWVGGTTQDGNITWTNIGKIGGQGPGFDVFYFSPTRGCSRANTRIAKIYRGTNEGPNWPVAPTIAKPTDPAGPFTTDSVGALFNLCMLQYASPTFANAQSCQGITSGTLSDVAGIHDGTIEMNSQYMAWSPTGGGSTLTGSDSWEAGKQSCRGSGASYTENSCYKLIWDEHTTTVRPLQGWVDDSGSLWCTPQPSCANGLAAEVWGGADGHQTTGYNVIWKTSHTQSLYLREPNYNLDAPTGVPVGSPNPGVQLLATPLGTNIANAPWDEHGAQRQATPLDNTPIFLFNTAVPARGGKGCVGTGAGVGNCTSGSPTGYPGSLLVGTTGSSSDGYNEITASASTSAGACAPPTSGNYCQYRFGHNWGTGSVGDFRGQNEQGMNSQDGTLAVVATDVMGTRGSISPDWTASTAGHSFTYNYGDMINPTASNTNHSSYQNLTGAAFVSGTAGNEPNWATCQTSGQTCADTSVSPNEVWTNVSQAATGHTGQLPCNGLRGDYESSPGTGIYLNDTIYPANNNAPGYIFEAVGCTPVAPATSCSLTGSNAIAQGASLSWGSLAFGSVTTDSNGINWQNLGVNDCRTDVILIDLMSAHAR